MKLLLKINAYYILLITGWRCIEFIGPPKTTTGTFIVCLKNNGIMEFNYSNFDGDIRWWKIGIGDQCNENPIIFWKPLPKPPYNTK